jgi:hypothetical protein
MFVITAKAGHEVKLLRYPDTFLDVGRRSCLWRGIKPLSAAGGLIVIILARKYIFSLCDLCLPAIALATTGVLCERRFSQEPVLNTFC